MKKLLTPLIILSLVVVFLSVNTLPGASAPEMKRVWVEFQPGKEGQVKGLLERNGAQFHYTFSDLNSFVVSLPEQALKGIAKNPNVVDIEEDAKRFVYASPGVDTLVRTLVNNLASGQSTPWGIDAVQAPQVWSAGFRGDGVTVCIIDTGFYAEHEDFAGASVLGGFSQVDDAWNRDGYGHGTHVAGTIAAQDNTLGVIGVAPNVSLYIVKIFDDAGNWTNASNLVDAINRCADNGADIISMSLGGTRGNKREQRAFDNLYNQGVLHIAAAGNDGNTAYSYPASYNSVVSVAAIDASYTIADFSQQNDQVELAAPGVSVLSTVPFTDENSVTVDGVTYEANHIEYAARGTALGPLVDGGLCDSTGNWSGAVVLCERGAISFLDKVLNVQNSGGVAALIYNNEPGNFFGTLGDGNSSAIIALSLSQEDGQFLVANKLGATGQVTSNYTWPASGYEAWDGTSMATPHVSAVAALLWSAFPNKSNVEIRDAMNATALDLGVSGKDNAYGYGLVQAYDALQYLGGGSSNTPPVASFTYTCTDLTCDFDASASYDPDGSIVSYNWDFGDGGSASGVQVNHTYASAGSFTVVLTVSDNSGANSSDSQVVSVSTSSGITLSASVFKDRGNKFVDLSWNGATSSNVDIYRNGSLLVTTANDGAYTDSLGKARGTFTYKVCEAGTTVCSNTVSVDL